MAEFEYNLFPKQSEWSPFEQQSNGLLVELAKLKYSDVSAQKSSSAIIEVDSAGRVQSIQRPDGSKDEFEYDANNLRRYKQSSADQKLTIWEPKSNADIKTPGEKANLNGAADKLIRWTSAQAPDDMLINLHVEKNGEVVYEDIPGATIKKLPDGSTLQFNVNGSKVTQNNEGQITRINKADGSTIDASYKNGEVNKFVVTQNNQRSEWILQPGGQWLSPGNLERRDHFSISSNGTESYVSSVRGNVTHIEYADGSNRSFSYAKGKINKVIEHSLEQHRDITWTRVADSDMWKAAGLAEKRMVVSASRNGDYSFIDQDGYKHTYKLDQSEEKKLVSQVAESQDLKDASRLLLKSASEQISDKERLRNFMLDVDLFKQEAHSRGIGSSKILSTLRELNSLMTPSTNSYLSSEQRIKLAEQALHTVAHPRSTDQGSHNTCGATSAEVVLSAKYPERLVNLLNQIADSGEYRTAKGLLLKPSSQSLEPDAEANSFDPYDAASEGVRSYVGQLVQSVGIDSIFAARNQSKIYESKDMREYVLRTDTGEQTSFDGLEDPDVFEMLRQLSGDDLEVYSKNKQFDSTDSLRDVLNQLKQNNAFPVVFSVDILKQGPFLNQYREDRAGLDDGGHYVTIWDIDSNGNVQIDDQFGRAYDFESLRRVPVADLFESSMTLRAAPVPHIPFMVPKKIRPGN